jgi:hypothetical protein
MHILSGSCIRSGYPFHGNNKKGLLQGLALTGDVAPEGLAGCRISGKIDNVGDTGDVGGVGKRGVDALE